MEARLRYLIIKMPDIHKIRIKLTGDGTQIARGLMIINVAFTVLEEGNQATSVLCNHSADVTIFKMAETITMLLLH